MWLARRPLWRALVWIVAVLVLLSTFGINLLPVLAGATVVGAALGFGAQSLVRDYLSGFFILVEDQYGIGDTISVAAPAPILARCAIRSRPACAASRRRRAPTASPPSR